MTSLLSPSRTSLIRRQYNSILRIKGFLLPVSQRTLSTADVKFAEQKNKYGGILTKIRNIFRQPEMTFQDVELLPIYGSKYKKQQRTQNRSLRKMLGYRSVGNNFLGNYYNSYLKFFRINKLFSDCNLAPVVIKEKTSLVSLSPARGIMGLAPCNSKPPITEPNMPPQQEKKDNKKEEKKKKKPVIKVDGKTTQELGKDVLALEAENYRYQWGVKLIEVSPAQEISAEDTDTPKYILKNSWGVKVKQLSSNFEEEAKIQENKVEKAGKIEEIGKNDEGANFKEGDMLSNVKVEEAKVDEVITAREIEKVQEVVKIEEVNNFKKLVNTVKVASVPEASKSTENDTILEATKPEDLYKTEISKTEVLGKIPEAATIENLAKTEEVFKTKEVVPVELFSKSRLETDSVKLDANIEQIDEKCKVDATKDKLTPENKNQTESSPLPISDDTSSDADYNIPKGLPHNAEVVAWQELADRSKLPIAEVVEEKKALDRAELVGPVFIRPEPPEPKLDVEAVKPVEASRAEDMKKPAENKGNRAELKQSSVKDPKSVDCGSSKKIHTDSRSYSTTVGVDSRSSSEVDVKNYLFLNTEKMDDAKNSVDPFVILDTESKPKSIVDMKKAVKVRYQENDLSNMKKASELPVRGPLLPTKVLTLTRINTDDMTYYNTLINKKVDEIYGREVEIELSSPSGIGDNILDVPLPTEITISVKPSLEKKVDSITWTPFLKAKDSGNYSTSFSGDNAFGGYFSGSSSDPFNGASSGFFNGSSSGSSGSKGRKMSNYISPGNETRERDRKSVLSAQEDEDDDEETEDYAIQGDYVRVPGDPYPYSREHFYKWRVPRQLDFDTNSVTKNLKRLGGSYNIGHGYKSDDFSAREGYNNAVVHNDEYNKVELRGENNTSNYRDEYNKVGNMDQFNNVDNRGEYNKVGNRDEYNTSGEYVDGYMDKNFNTATYFNKDSYNNAEEYNTSSYETEVLDEMEEDQEDYYNKMTWEAEGFGEENKDASMYAAKNEAASAPIDILMNRNIYRTANSKGVELEKSTKDIEKKEFYSVEDMRDEKLSKNSELKFNKSESKTLEVSKNMGKNAETLRVAEANKNLNKSREYKEDAGNEIASKSEALTGPDVSKTGYGQQNQEKSKFNTEEEAGTRNPNEHPWAIPVEKNKSDESKNATAVEETEAISGRTIHPEITPQEIANEKSIATELKDRVSEFVKKGVSTELSKAGPEPLQESIYNIRYREMKISKEDIYQIHEMKNYAYLRFDELKDTLTPLIDRKKKKNSKSTMF